MLLQKILEDILLLEKRLNLSSTNPFERIAVFDLDHTLIDGDIGEAVFAMSLAMGFSVQLSWKEYQVLLNTNQKKAYEAIVKALEGLSIGQLITITAKVMDWEKPVISFSGETVVVPTPNPIMKELIRVLKVMGFIPYVISASNDVSVKIVASEWFGIPVGNAFGIKTYIHHGKLTAEIQTPIPIGEGKVALYHQILKGTQPVIVATDSMGDLPLLQMCDPHGLVIIAGMNDELLQSAKSTLPLSTQIHTIPTLHTSEFDLQRKKAG